MEQGVTKGLTYGLLKSTEKVILTAVSFETDQKETFQNLIEVRFWQSGKKCFACYFQIMKEVQDYNSKLFFVQQGN